MEENQAKAVCAIMSFFLHTMGEITESELIQWRKEIMDKTKPPSSKSLQIFDKVLQLSKEHAFAICKMVIPKKDVLIKACEEFLNDGIGEDALRRSTRFYINSLIYDKDYQGQEPPDEELVNWNEERI